MSDVAWYLQLLNRAAELIDIGPANVSRAIIRPIIDAGIKLDFGVADLTRALREPFQYLPYRDLQKIVREEYSLMRNRDLAFELSEHMTPSKASFAQGEFSYDAKYFVTFRVKVTYTDTGVTEITYRNMYTNDRVSPAKWWEEFEESFNNSTYEEAREYEFLGMESYSHNRGYDW